MKKLVYVLIFVVFSSQITFAGGIMTNSNQSAAWVRMLVRDASLGMDAVYYNPAGLTFLEDGFFLSLNNQTLVQNRQVTSNYSLLLHETQWDGSVSAPLFPGVYTGYKMGKLVISLGVNPVGGGGSATYDKGLPSFEYGVADLVPLLSASGLGVTNYSLDAMFEGSSIFWGIQLGASYAINDMFSVYLGGRYVTAKTIYTGHLKDIQANIAGGEMQSLNTYATSTLQGLSDAVTNTDALVAGGAGVLTLDQAVAGGIITAEQQTALVGGLVATGLYDATTVNAMDITTINLVYEGVYAAQEPTLTALAAGTADQEADVEQTGSGFTPIVGLNINLDKKLNIGIKYEFKTELELENETVAGKEILLGTDENGAPVYMFPDGAKTRQDMPALLSIGADYKFTDKFSAQIGFHHYWDKTADYGKMKQISLDYPTTQHVKNEDLIESNLIEWAIGFEYKINEKFLASIGYLGTKTGVKDEYHSDLSFSNSSTSFGAGIEYTLNEMIALNVGFASTSYSESSKTFERNNPDPLTVATTPTITIEETYDKDNIFIGIGVDFKF